MSILKQKTLKKEINLSGVGLHSGNNVNIKLVPQRPNTGIYFKRTDLTSNNIIYPSVFNVSSIFGASGGFGKSSSYHASKGAVSALTRNAAIRYANDNIRINSVSPGFIKVLREEKTIEEAGDTMSQDIISRTPMGRWGDADEVAAAIHFLASSESSYITGAELFVDGGWMAT